MAFQISLFQIIFEQFLKISPDLISKYTTIQDQLLYLILIPNVILLLFLISFSESFTGKHRGMQLLVAITSYIFIIWSGWYGLFIVPLVTSFFTITIILAFATFLFVRIFHPFRVPGAAAAALSIGSDIGKKLKGENLDEQLEDVNRLLRSLGFTVKSDEEIKIPQKVLENKEALGAVAQLMTKREEIIRKLHKGW